MTAVEPLVPEGMVLVVEGVYPEFNGYQVMRVALDAINEANARTPKVIVLDPVVREGQ